MRSLLPPYSPLCVPSPPLIISPRHLNLGFPECSPHLVISTLASPNVPHECSLPRWHSYTEAEAKSDVERWIADDLPIDVWALDMNWRNTSHDQDHFYDHPATPNLFTNFTDWFAYLKGKNLRTYFNDHPFPVASRGAGGLQVRKRRRRRGGEQHRVCSLCRGLCLSRSVCCSVCCGA